MTGVVVAGTTETSGERGPSGTEGGSAPSAEWIDSEHGPELLEIRTGGLRLVLLPAHGGRLLGLARDGVELLWQDRTLLDDALRWRPGAAAAIAAAPWANLGGSKAWPAPQAVWAGPPGPLDADPYSTEIVAEGGSLAITLRAAPRGLPGLRVERRLAIPASGGGFSSTTTFSAAPGTEHRWSVWEVCQVDTLAGLDGSGRIRIQLDGREPAVRLMTGSDRDGAPGYELAEAAENGDEAWAEFAPQPVIDKVGFRRASGELEYRRGDGRGLRLRALPTTPRPGDAHPDGGSKAAVYTQAEPARQRHLVYTELEVMTPIRRITPEHPLEQRLEWTTF